VEDQYEHKLAVEMERYDKLSEEIELMKDECNAKLEDQKLQSETTIREYEQRANRMEQQLRHQVCPPPPSCPCFFSSHHHSFQITSALSTDHDENGIDDGIGVVMAD